MNMMPQREILSSGEKKHSPSQDEESSSLSLFDDNIGYDIPNDMLGTEKTTRNLSWEDIQINGYLGQGGFSTVYKVQIKGENPYETQKSPSLALKFVDEKKFSSYEAMTAGIEDLVMEATLLSSLDHKNVIKLRGTCLPSLPMDIEDVAGSPECFILLELLQDSLSDRLRQWRFDLQHSKKSEKNLLLPSTKSNKEYYPETSDMLHRIKTVAIGVASGMQYLHANNIVLRDLKPDNIGFDCCTGQVKIFDLGLARKMDNIDFDPKEMAGTIRYMAPEVLLADCCGQSSDVYSFALMLLELCTLKKPYSKFKTIEAFHKNATKSKPLRPSTKHIKNDAICQLLEQCWHKNSFKRPSFTNILDFIQNDILSPKPTKPTRKLEKIGSIRKMLQPLYSQFNESGNTVLSLDDEENDF